MDEIEMIASLRAELDRARAHNTTVGFVPTMGFLHQGHTSLMRTAAEECDLVVASIFVNPLQFGAGEDLESYPRDLARDRRLAEGAGVDLLFVPSGPEMYPTPVLTEVRVDRLSGTMEGASRPTHFAGVATVVAKLFSIVGSCRAYFGEKDFQQLAVVRRMTSDLSLPVQVVGCPTVREPDGLAMSSRNAYLDDAEREAAPVLHRALQAGAASIVAGERDSDAVRSLMGEIISAEPSCRLDYAEVVRADDLVPVHALEPGDELRLLVAAQLGRPRLLDNVGITVRS
jgi:pantoate--beta-alanine ligase